MSTRPLTEIYLERAQALEDHAERLENDPERLERIPPSICLSPRWRNATFMRREAQWWRSYAEALAIAA